MAIINQGSLNRRGRVAKRFGVSNKTTYRWQKQKPPILPPPDLVANGISYWFDHTLDGVEAMLKAAALQQQQTSGAAA